MIDLRENFIKWLIKEGLSEKTPSGNPSTVYDYLAKIDGICKKEGHIFWEELAGKLFSIAPRYQGKYKTALHKYNEFLLNVDLPVCVRQERRLDILYALSLDADGKIKIDDNKDFYTPTEAAALLRVSRRTLSRWRQKKKGPEYRKDNNTGKITYPKPCLEKYINESLIKI